ncbi:MAG: rhamnulokinase [Lentisphaerae bacterium]|nr:rhamnulokinase [Lentisphaerota bacterium]
MMSEKKLFCVDLGASGGKCFVGTFKKSGDFTMDEVHRFDHGGTSFYLADRSGAVSERSYWDDTAIYDNIIKGLHAYRRERGSSVDAIGIDTWGADGAFMSADGEMLGKVHTYRDHRLDAMCAEVIAKLGEKQIYSITGVHFQPFNVSNQLLWFVTRRPELLKLAERFLPVPTLFNFYLSGATAVDSSWASVTQLMDAATHEWSETIMSALGVPERVMPQIVEPGTIIGKLRPELAEAIGISRADVVAVGAHDTASAFAAAPIDDPDHALIISSGTWSLVGRLIPKPITSEAAMVTGISNEGGIGNTRFLKNCMGTWIVQELLRVWEAEDGKRMSWREVDTIAPAAAAFSAFIDPDDKRFYNPANMESAIREFITETGQQQPVGRGTILRVVYESLALKYRMVNEQIVPICGTPTKVVHIVGGGSGNLLLNQFTANALNLPVHAGPKEATAVGNLMVQAMAKGIIGSMAEAQPFIRKTFAVQTFMPQDVAAWDESYQKFGEICCRAKGASC